MCVVSSVSMFAAFRGQVLKHLYGLSDSAMHPKVLSYAFDSALEAGSRDICDSGNITDSIVDKPVPYTDSANIDGDCVGKPLLSEAMIIDQCELKPGKDTINADYCSASIDNRTTMLRKNSGCVLTTTASHLYSVLMSPLDSQSCGQVQGKSGVLGETYC